MVTVWCNTTYLDEYPFDRYECKFEYENMDGNDMNIVNITTRPRLERILNGSNEEFDFKCGKVMTEILWWDNYNIHYTVSM